MFHKFLFLGLITAIVSILDPPWAPAGGGPENVCLVVNAESADSKALANHYMQLRHIPPGNVVYISTKPDANEMSMSSFAREILRPVLEAVVGRRLDPQIDCIVYSCDFPWRISFRNEVDEQVKQMSRQKRGKVEWPAVLGNRGSLTGLTYFYPRTLGGNIGFVAMNANRYMRPIVRGRQTEPTMAFRGDYRFDPSGKLVPKDGDQYLLSTVLAVTPAEKRRGISVKEAMAYLSRSVKADGTQPPGKIYFTLTSDIRTKKRSEGFACARDALHELGIATEVISTNMPMRENNVLGLTSGTPKFEWDQTGSTILPGAICDNLTSGGGVFQAGMQQTCQAEFLKHGAAGCSGTVIEPRLVLEKFPDPMIHAHYARGCSLAEAFYQAVYSPYQLLVMGDPLCQPFARIPQVEVAGIQPQQRVEGTLTLQPKAIIPPKVRAADPNARATATEEAPESPPADAGSADEVDHFELFVDGKRHQQAKPGEPLSLDTRELGDGFHELRIVAVGPSPISTQGRKIVWIVTDNHGHSIKASVPSRRVPLGETVPVTIDSPGAKLIELRHNGRMVGMAYGASGTVKCQADKLGKGFNYLQPVGVYGNEPKDQAFAMPIVLWVD